MTNLAKMTTNVNLAGICGTEGRIQKNCLGVRFGVWEGESSGKGIPKKNDFSPKKACFSEF